MDDALAAGDVPVLLAAECSVALTTLAAVARHRADARVLWLDAHGDFNTPETTSSGYLGGMALAGACGRWDAGLGEAGVPAERVALAGVRDLESAERKALEDSAVTVIGASPVETLVAVKNALDGAPVYVHLDLDVLDPDHFPAQFPAPGGLSPDKLYRPARGGGRRLRAGRARSHRVPRSRRRVGAPSCRRRWRCTP